MTSNQELRELLAWAYRKLDDFGVGKTMPEGHPSILKMDAIKLALLSGDSSAQKRPRLASDIRCRHAKYLTEPCVACEQISTEGGERVICLGEDGVLTRLTHDEPVHETRARQRYSVTGRFIPLSENGVPQNGLTIIHETTHDVFICDDRPSAEETKPSGPTMAGESIAHWWRCPNCRSRNDPVTYHTSCPHCGTLKPPEKAPAEDAAGRPLCAHGNFVDECPHPHTDTQ